MAENNPYAIYVFCDAGMDYNSKNTGGVGINIEFPDFVDLENIRIPIGRYEGGNIERYELEAIIQGMNRFLEIFKENGGKLKDVNTVIFRTDRCSLNDQEKTSPYKIKNWRRGKELNYEGKPILNFDLLDALDKKRTKIINETRCFLKIEYIRRKENKIADKLSEEGKKKVIVNKKIAIKGLKIRKRIYGGDEINYNALGRKDNLLIHVFLKRYIKNQWEVGAEICEGQYLGNKFKMYVDYEMGNKLSSKYLYGVKIKNVFQHHIRIYKTVKKQNR